MSEAGEPLLDPREETFDRAKSFLERGMLDDAIEQLEILAQEGDWRDRVIELAKRIASVAARSGPKPRRLDHLLQLLDLLPLYAPDEYSIAEDAEDVGRSPRRGSPIRRGPRRRRGDPSISLAEAAEKWIVESRALVERTPHLEIGDRTGVTAGETFSANVYLDTLPAGEGERTEPVRAFLGTRVEMTLATSGHFKVVGQATNAFIMDATTVRTDVGAFKIRVEDMPDEIEGEPFLAAIFYVDGRPCGSVTRSVEIVDPSKPIDLEIRDPATLALEAKPAVVIGPNGLVPADITVTVVAAEVNDGRSFVCTVETAYPGVAGERKTAPWVLASATRDLVTGFMELFTAQPAGSRQLIAELTGAGKELFDASPRIFREAFWSLIDSGKSIRTIAVVTAEPFVPWELMVPSRWKNDQPEERPPLGVEFQLARWTDLTVISPPRRIVLRDSFVIAPTYPPKKQLPNSEAEAAMVLQRYPGDRISPADFDTIEAKLGSESRTLVHFICHGEDGENGIQSILLEGGRLLPSHAMLGMAGLAKLFHTKRPVVFLNACKVGQTLPSLVGLGGFVASFIKLGATAVIAPLWSVDDGVALDVATQFYERLSSEPTVPLSKIFADIRAKSYATGSAQDTYAAYCFYGDPFAALA